MSSSQLGHIQEEDNIGHRDAAHVAIVTVACRHNVKLGSYLKFVNKECTEVEPCNDSSYHGIADPFLSLGQLDKYMIPANKPFLMLVKPGLAKNLVHHYTLDIVIEEDPDDIQCRDC
jgi:hypothetical protein